MRFVLGALMVLIQAGSIVLLPLHPTSAQEAMAVAEAIPNRYIVRLKPSSGVTAAAVASTYDSQPGVLVDQVYSHVFSGFAGEFTNQAATRLATDPKVLDVFPDRLSYLAI